MRRRQHSHGKTPEPQATKTRKQITIRIEMGTIDYFKKLAERTGLSYQNLMNLYLADCVRNDKKIDLAWK